MDKVALKEAEQLQVQIARKVKYDRERNEARAKIIEALKADGKSIIEIAIATGISSWKAREYIKELKDEGIIGKGYFYIWQSEKAEA